MFSCVKPNNTCSLDSICLSLEVSSLTGVSCLWRTRHETDPKHTTCVQHQQLPGGNIADPAMGALKTGCSGNALTTAVPHCQKPSTTLSAGLLPLTFKQKKSQHVIRRFNFTVVVSRFALEILMLSKGNQRLHDQTDNAGTDKAVSHSAFSIQISDTGIPWILLNTHQTELHEFHYLKLHSKESHWMTVGLFSYNFLWRPNLC